MRDPPMCHCIHFVWTVYCWTWSLAFRVVGFPLRRTGIHSWIVINWTQLGLGTGACVHFSQCWDSIWCRPNQALCMLPQTLWVCLCLEVLASCPPSILALNLLLPPLLQNSLSTEWRDMTETCHLGLSAPRPFTLCTLSSCRSLDFIPSTEMECFSNDIRVGTDLLVEQNVIGSHFENRTIVSVFFLRSLALLVSLAHPVMMEMGSISWSEP